MADTKHTPTTDEVRDDYRRAHYYLNGHPPDPGEFYRSCGPEFDRWLADHDFEVEQAAYMHGWDEGFEAGERNVLDRLAEGESRD